MFDRERGFGFIRRDDGKRDIFIHNESIRNFDIDSDPVGRRIEFREGLSKKKKALKAVSAIYSVDGGPCAGSRELDNSDRRRRGKRSRSRSAPVRNSHRHSSSGSECTGLGSSSSSKSSRSRSKPTRNRGQWDVVPTDQT